MADERREHLLMVVDHLIETWNEWCKPESPRYITKSFEDAIDQTLTMFGDGSIPGDLRVMHARVESLRAKWEAWVRRNSGRAVQEEAPSPFDGFWGSLEGIETAREATKSNPRRVLESVTVLKSYNPPVGDRQICRTYGWLDARGNPESWKIEEEMRDPGCHSTKLPGWMPPHERRRIEVEQQQAQAIERVREQRAAKLKVLEPAPEPLAELVRQGLSARQIAKMKRITPDEVYQQCAEAGLPEPPMGYETANAMRGDHDADSPADAPQDRAENARNASEEVGRVFDPSGAETLEAQIVAFYRQGLDNEAIKAAVSSDDYPVDGRKVAAVIRRYKADPAAFEGMEV